jgi:hypothetical protein
MADMDIRAYAFVADNEPPAGAGLVGTLAKEAPILLNAGGVAGIGEVVFPGIV